MEDTNSDYKWSDIQHPNMSLDTTAVCGFNFDAEAPDDIDEPLDLVVDEFRTPSCTPSPNKAHKMSVCDMIRTLTQPNVGLFPHGVSPKDLFDFMCKLPEDQRASKSRNHLQVLLWREVKAGKICRLSVGVYTVPEFLEQIAPHYKRRTISPPTSTMTMLSDEVVSTMRNVDSLLQAQTRNEAFTLHNESDTPLWSATNGATPQFIKIKRKRKKESKIAAASVENVSIAVPVVETAHENNAFNIVAQYLDWQRAQVKLANDELVSSTTQNVETPPVTSLLNASSIDQSATKPKRKRAKKLQAPNELIVAKAVVGRLEVCYYCQMSHEENFIGAPERLLCCADCPFIAHPICMNYSKEIADKCRTYAWQCGNCKVCSICLSIDEEAMIFCDCCDKGFHVLCHTPKVDLSNHTEDDKWICSGCCKQNEKKTHINGYSHKQIVEGKFPLVNVAKKLELLVDGSVESNGNIELKTKICNVQVDEYGLPSMADDPIIKRAANEAMSWTVDHVFQFISDLGFPKQAIAFKREEIDGQALLLLRRTDILSMLSLKLGPALKIHRRLSTLQLVESSTRI